jgi:hypothetical protein
VFLPETGQAGEGVAAAVAEAVDQQRGRALVVLLAGGGEGLEKVDGGVEILDGVGYQAEGAGDEEQAGGGVEGEMLGEILIGGY